MKLSLLLVWVIPLISAYNIPPLNPNYNYWDNWARSPILDPRHMPRQFMPYYETQFHPSVRAQEEIENEGKNIAIKEQKLKYLNRLFQFIEISNEDRAMEWSESMDNLKDSYEKLQNSYDQTFIPRNPLLIYGPRGDNLYTRMIVSKNYKKYIIFVL